MASNLRGKKTAYHEAGHAVAHTILDGRVPKLATIVPSDDSEGHVRPAGRSRFAKIHNAYGGIDPFRLEGAKALAYAEIEMVCFLAGAAAQKRFAPRSKHRLGAGFRGAGELVAHGSDLDKVIHRLDTIWSVSLEQSRQKLMDCHYRYLEERAKVFVAEHWDAIERVAKALLKHFTLNAEQIHAAVYQPLAEQVEGGK